MTQKLTAQRSNRAWSAEDKERVKALWLDGKSASEIERIVGAVSRSAVIGLVHRMGCKRVEGDPRLYSKAARDARKRKTQERQAQAAKARGHKGLGIRAPTREQIAHSRLEFEAIQRKLAAEPEVALVKHVFDLEPHHCRWPIGDGPLSFCGVRHVPGSSYCARHLIRSKAGKDVAKVYANMAGAHIDMHVFGLEELTEKATA